MAISNGSSDRSGTSASTILWSWVKLLRVVEASRNLSYRMANLQPACGRGRMLTEVRFVKLQPESLGTLPKGQKLGLGEVHNGLPLPQSSTLASRTLPACPLLICAAHPVSRDRRQAAGMAHVEGAGRDHRSCLPGSIYPRPVPGGLHHPYVRG